MAARANTSCVPAPPVWTVARAGPVAGALDRLWRKAACAPGVLGGASRMPALAQAWRSPRLALRDSAQGVTPECISDQQSALSVQEEQDLVVYALQRGEVLRLVQA